MAKRAGSGRQRGIMDYGALNALFLISKVPLYILGVFDAYMVGPWTLGHCP